MHVQTLTGGGTRVVTSLAEAQERLLDDLRQELLMLGDVPPDVADGGATTLIVTPSQLVHDFEDYLEVVRVSYVPSAAFVGIWI